MVGNCIVLGIFYVSIAFLLFQVNSLASLGKYEPSIEPSAEGEGEGEGEGAANQSLYIENHAYWTQTTGKY